MSLVLPEHINPGDIIKLTKTYHDGTVAILQGPLFNINVHTNYDSVEYTFYVGAEVMVVNSGGSGPVSPTAWGISGISPLSNNWLYDTIVEVLDEPNTLASN